jgi:hypothetical protein
MISSAHEYDEFASVYHQLSGTCISKSMQQAAATISCAKTAGEGPETYI